MTAIYYHLLRFLANREADAAIRKVLRANSSSIVKFRYGQGCLTTKTYIQDPTNATWRWAEEVIERVAADIQRINAERQNTLDRLCRERNGQEEWH